MEQKTGSKCCHLLTAADWGLTSSKKGCGGKKENWNQWVNVTTKWLEVFYFTLTVLGYQKSKLSLSPNTLSIKLARLVSLFFSLFLFLVRQRMKSHSFEKTDQQQCSGKKRRFFCCTFWHDYSSGWYNWFSVKSQYWSDNSK